MNETTSVVEAASQVTDATHQPNPNEQPEAQPDVPAETDRPAWLPDKFNTPEDLAASYKQLEQKLHDPNRQAEQRQSLIEEIEASKLEGVPEDATGYEIPEALGDSETINPALWEATQNWAFERNLSQDDLGELVSFYAENFLPNVDAEFEKLGPQAQSRAQALGAWVGANVPEAHRATIMNMAVTAENFQALEAMMKLTVPQALPGQTEQPKTEALDEAKVRQLMMSPEYADPQRRSPEVVKQVDDWFRQKYPNT